jgi:hypothetical protein
VRVLGRPEVRRLPAGAQLPDRVLLDPLHVAGLRRPRPGRRRRAGSAPGAQLRGSRAPRARPCLQPASQPHGDGQGHGPLAAAPCAAGEAPAGPGAQAPRECPCPTSGFSLPMRQRLKTWYSSMQRASLPFTYSCLILDLGPAMGGCRRLQGGAGGGARQRWAQSATGQAAHLRTSPRTTWPRSSRPAAPRAPPTCAPPAESSRRTRLRSPPPPPPPRSSPGAAHQLIAERLPTRRRRALDGRCGP